ncbi:MAG: undecaprenyl-phosphate glucose phosphotransferase [Deltaproteobacteria bacterium]|nr:undecaprenyl-phosphate glucose phosphotransferase [Deltaproteobacteria bacterium]MBT4526898.1 undecaprenyl-phosphate glucose phosphotransferase [Deltaproteobacteria bacterium]
MLKKQSQVFLSILFFCDLCLISGSWLLAYYLRFYGINYPAAVTTPLFYIYLRACAVVTIFGAFCLIYSKMYTPKRISNFRAELRSIFNSNLILWIILTALTFYFRKYSFSRVHSLYFIALSISTLIIFRFTVRRTLLYLRSKGKNLRRILIIGSGYTAKNLVIKLNNNHGLGLYQIGLVSEHEKNKDINLNVIGNYPDIPEIIAKYNVDQVFIALDSNQQSDLAVINKNLAEQMVDLHIVPDVYHTLNINPEIAELDGLPIIVLRQSNVGGWDRVFKRIFDLVVALCSIIVVFPLWIIIPLVIKLTSRGPVFFKQERMGLDGKSFHMLKFRSMQVNAESETGAVWAIKGDARTTKIGAFLRKTSLDEIPQLFNVIQGTMSIVGPRPERPVFISEFKTQIPNYMLRHKMKAGITGWAQVNGWRGNTSLEKRIECDIYYLTHWSIWFDIKIFILTIFKGFVNPNAY